MQKVELKEGERLQKAGLYMILLIILNIPVILSKYFCKETGRDYNVGFLAKLSLIFKMIRNNFSMVAGSNFLEHLVMATTILNIPKSVEGSVVECGSWKGVSATNLSLVCKLVNRQLEIFDSFKGLPAPSEHDVSHYCFDRKQVHSYTEGYASGTLQEVKRNIARYGEIEVCNFNVGYFDETLPRFQKKCVFVFEDADLKSSVETCLRYLWPLLNDGCYFFTHEAIHMEVASLFFDKDWWRNNLNCAPPGLIGAGSGLGLLPNSGGYNSAIGYIIKNPKLQDYIEVPHV